MDTTARLSYKKIFRRGWEGTVYSASILGATRSSVEFSLFIVTRGRGKIMCTTILAASDRLYRVSNIAEVR